MSESGPDFRMDYVEFPARDLAVTKRFYGDAFGWRFTDYGEDYCSFEDGRIGGGFTTAAAPGGGGPLVVLYARDLEAAVARVLAAGGAIVKPIFPFPGGRRFHFTDPSGNELGVWSDRGGG
jgi:predicted enzyme related to lactoylglutathione lyase